MVDPIEDVVEDDIIDVEDDDLITDADDDISDVLDEEDPAVIDEDPAPSDADPDPKPKKKGGVQRRIDKLTKRASKAELEAAYYKGLAEGKNLSNAGADPEPEPEPEVRDRPKLSRDDFETDEDYLDARLDQKIRAKETATTAKERVDAVNAQYTESREKYDDFDEIALAQHLPITHAMFEAAMGDKLGDILYHLGKNPDLAMKISQMTPMVAAREIGKIEVAIVDPKPKPTKKEPKTSKAPEPVPKVKSSGSPTATDEGAETQAQRMARWDKEREDRIKSGLAA